MENFHQRLMVFLGIDTSIFIWFDARRENESKITQVDMGEMQSM